MIRSRDFTGANQRAERTKTCHKASAELAWFGLCGLENRLGSRKAMEIPEVWGKKKASMLVGSTIFASFSAVLT